MILSQLIADVEVVDLRGVATHKIERLTYDSRSVVCGDCFFAIKGEVSDGHLYIESAVERGAVAVVCERLPQTIDADICYVVVEHTNRAMAQMASKFYGDPSRELKLVGITGTNGKTTTATLLCDGFEGLGYKVGLS